MAGCDRTPCAMQQAVMMTMPQGGPTEQAMSDLSQNIPATEGGRWAVSTVLNTSPCEFP